MNNKTYEPKEYIKVMDLPGGMRALRLVGDETIKQTVNTLRISTKNWRFLTPTDQVCFYALCSHDNQPQVMIYIKNNAVYLCRAQDNSRPTQYMPQIVNFIVSNQFNIAGDMACTGLVKQKGNYYNIYDLPQHFIYHGDMDLSFAGLYELPDMSTVTIRGNYDIRGNRIRNFDGAPREVFGDFDISKNRYVPIAFRKLHTIIHGRFINDCHAKQNRGR